VVIGVVAAAAAWRRRGRGWLYPVVGVGRKHKLYCEGGNMLAAVVASVQDSTLLMQLPV